MSEIRVYSCISPNIASSLNSYNITDNLVSLFKNIITLFDKFKHLTLLIIPNEYISIFNSHPHLRILKELIETNSQSNVIFGSIVPPDKCPHQHINLLFDPSSDIDLVYRQILWMLSKKRVPVVIDCDESQISKELCNECDKQQPCHPAIILTSCQIPEVGDFDKYLTSIAELGIEHWRISRNSIEPNDLKVLAILTCILYKVPHDILPKIGKILVHPDFCKDIARDSQCDIVNLVFSMIRVIAFPSATDPNSMRHELSIDWHRNNPTKLVGHNLFRADVVSSNKSGIRNSGVERLLFTFKGDDKYFLAYTSTHDFVNDTIEKRLKSKSKDMKK